jgi:hypothetical protein
LDAKTFFMLKLAPLAEEYRRRGLPLIPLAAEPEAKTYFVDRERRSMRPDDFELAGTASIDEFRQALAAHWTAAGHPALAELAPDFASLAEALYQVVEQGEEVSPFIYVMF